jgi:cysteinyl-tRNA synthetase
MLPLSLSRAWLLAAALLSGTYVEAWVLPSLGRTTRIVLDQSSAATNNNDLPEVTLYNSLTRQKEGLVPLQAGRISMYTCGPTVYDYAHVGNFRAFLTYDVLKRVLQYFGYQVIHICNLTDVDDKIIQRATELGLTSALELTRKFEALFLQDLVALNIVPAQEYPRATEHVDDMMDMIATLQEKGLAYETADGSWYFRTQAQQGYGQQLVQFSSEASEEYNEQQQPQQQSQQQPQQQQGVAPEDGKEHFWKAYKRGLDRDDLVWERPPQFQKGRPGWHLECSAMARKYLGDTIDLHGGGIDLKFPHHENEIAQSQGVTGKPFCNCWFHNGFVNINAEKMSKSLGNFLTLSTACPSAIDVRAYRYLVVSSQYRNPLNFSPKAMQAAKSALKRIDAVQTQLSDALKQYDDPNDIDSNGSILAKETVPKAMQDFEAALLDDLSMPRAAASLFGLVKAVETEIKRASKGESLDLPGLAAIQSALRQMDQVFGIFYQVPESHASSSEKEEGSDVPQEVLVLVEQRTAAKESKDWELADSLRARITELGFAVKDVKGGEPLVRRLE